MKPLILIACLLLSGCYVTQSSFEIATTLCEPNGGVQLVEVYSYEALCKNGVRVRWAGKKDTPR